MKYLCCYCCKHDPQFLDSEVEVVSYRKKKAAMNSTEMNQLNLRESRNFPNFLCLVFFLNLYFDYYFNKEVDISVKSYEKEFVTVNGIVYNNKTSH